MKRSEMFFSTILIPLDAIMVIISFILAYYLRKNVGDVVWFWTFSEYLKFILILLPIWIAIFALEGLYNVRHARRGLDEFVGVVLGVSSGIMLVVAWIFLSRTFFFSRLVIIYAWVFGIILVYLARKIIRYLQHYLYRYGIGVHRLVLIGNNDVAYNIIKDIRANRGLGYKLAGIIATPDDKAEKKKTAIKVLGELTDFEKIINGRPIDELILTDPNISDSRIMRIIKYCEENDIAFKQVPNLFKVKTSNIDSSSLAGFPIMEYRRTPLDGWGRVIKRLIDFFGALVGLLVFSPVMLVIAIAIKLDSRGPVIYKNHRIDHNVREFTTYKFRSMHLNYCTGEEYNGKKAEEYERELIKQKSKRVGPVYKILNDPRRTRVGRFLEKTSLDELPQFYNVLLGNMSLVGPRPHQPREVAEYLPHHKKVFYVKPGITGLTQTSGRSDLDFEDEVRLDTYYIENWSLWLDCKIMLKTPYAALGRRRFA